MISKTIKVRYSINVLQNTSNEILLLKRSKQVKLGPELWGFPAGHIEKDESPQDCAERELREEIGTDFKTKLLKEFGPVRDTQYGGIYEIFLFHHYWLEGVIRLNHEHTEFSWAALSTLNNYNIMPGLKEDLTYLGIV